MMHDAAGWQGYNGQTVLGRMSTVTEQGGYLWYSSSRKLDGRIVESGGRRLSRFLGLIPFLGVLTGGHSHVLIVQNLIFRLLHSDRIRSTGSECAFQSNAESVPSCN